jgi:hypothetical protein
VPDAPKKFSHRATGKFWIHYRQLPPEIQRLADRTYLLLKKTRVIRRCNSRKLARPGRCASVCIIALWPFKFPGDFFGSGLGFTTNTI